jgi:N-methylhydantoinase B
MAHDPVTLTVIEAGLAAAADEMFAVLRKTAMSPIIYEVLDCGTGITDGTGRLVSSGAGIPTFVGALDKAVAHIVERHGDTIRDGDLFLTNDPHDGGVTHLNDMVVAQPVFHDDALVAWAATMAHWSDVGGRVPGSMAVDATEIWQEGLRVPAIRLFEQGRLVKPVLDILTVNSRQPDLLRGDLWAQVAAGRRASARIGAVLDRHGRAAFDAALAAAFARGRSRALARLATLPAGRHAIRARQDDGSEWRAAITISPDGMVVDLRGNPAQGATPWNLSRAGAEIAAQMIFKAVVDPVREANAGSFGPLTLLTEPGSLFHALPPAPEGYYFETRIRLLDLLWRCLAEAMPERLPAGHFGTIGGVVIAGIHPDTGRRFTMVEPQMGGWGATATRDGLDAMFSASHGETFNCPVEIAEARYGLQVLRRELVGAPGGAGRHQGGRGVETVFHLRGAAVLSAGFSHVEEPVWGLAGGGTGGRNGLMVVRAEGGARRHGAVSGLPLRKGDRVEIRTAGGGGWGCV